MAWAALMRRFRTTCPRRASSAITSGAGPYSRTSRARYRISFAAMWIADSRIGSSATRVRRSSRMPEKVRRSRTTRRTRSAPSRASASARSTSARKAGAPSIVRMLVEELQGGAEVSERVVDLVREAGGDHPDRREPVGLHELRLHGLDLGDVEQRPREPDRSTHPVHLGEPGLAVRGHPPDRPVRPHRPVLLLVPTVAGRIRPALRRGADRLPVVRVDEAEERLEVRDGRFSDPEDLAAARRPLERAVGGRVKRPEPGGVDREREALLALAQRLLGGEPLGRIADDADQHALSVEQHALRADLDGEGRAVPAPVLGVEADPVRVRSRELGLRESGRRRSAQVEHRHPAQLLARPAVRGRRRGVRLEDPAVVPADEEDDVPRVLGEEVVAALDAAERDRGAALPGEGPAQPRVEHERRDRDEPDALQGGPPGDVRDRRGGRGEDRVGEGDPGHRDGRVDRGDPQRQPRGGARFFQTRRRARHRPGSTLAHSSSGAARRGAQCPIVRARAPGRNAFGTVSPPVRRDPPLDRLDEVRPSSRASMIRSSEPTFRARSTVWIASNSSATSPTFSERTAVSSSSSRRAGGAARGGGLLGLDDPRVLARAASPPRGRTPPPRRARRR